jgi:hypothetical protein
LYLGEETRSARALANWLRDGFVAARAEELVQVHPHLFGPNGRPNRESNAELTVELWQSRDFVAEVDRWDWERGEFTVTFPVGGDQARATAYGVTFRAWDIISKLPEGDPKFVPTNEETIPPQRNLSSEARGRS